jgi:ATP-dependent DNA helicase DinG
MPGENPLELARRELQSKLNRLTQWLENFLTALNPKADDLVYWVEAAQRQGKLVFCAEPVNGGPLLAEMLFDPLRAVVCTSATITVDGSFDFFLERSGLAAPDPGRRERTVTQLLSSPFRYDEHLALVLLSYLPEPGASSYRNAVSAACREALEITGGRTFILCTSWDQVRFLGEALREYCGGRGFTLFMQGTLPRERLLGLFRADISSVLIGTDSFWEGVDVPGESLSQVIITRLPFKVPTEPLEQARVEWLQKQGQSPFMQYSLPRAVIKFRQGFGRLIRTDRDRGLVTVLDQRILSKPYGRVFLDSLPGGRQFSGENVLAKAAAWWKLKNRTPLTG